MRKFLLLILAVSAIFPGLLSAQNDDDLFEGGLLDGGSRRRHVLPVEYEVAYVFEEGGFSQLQLVLVARYLRNFIEKVDNLEGEIVDAITEHCKHLA